MNKQLTMEDYTKIEKIGEGKHVGMDMCYFTFFQRRIYFVENFILVVNFCGAQCSLLR